MIHALMLALILAESGAADLLARWDALEKGVRDGKIVAAEAREQVRLLVPALRARWNVKAAPRWTPPGEGGDRSWIGGTRGEGFRPDSPKPAYSWYDGNRHGGHPAHDVFVPDRDGDCRDDHTGQPFYAVAMQPGIVLSINENFRPGEPRGGKYVWLFCPDLDLLLYYAHLDTILVRPGDVLKAGDRIGTIGKTGFSKKLANKPCHIHLMALKIADGEMRPYDFFRDVPAKVPGAKPRKEPTPVR